MPEAAPPAELTRYIEERYHSRHRAELPQLAALAARVEEVHAGACGTGRALNQELAAFVADLQAHIRLENEVLFPPFEIASHQAESETHV